MRDCARSSLGQLKSRHPKKAVAYFAKSRGKIGVYDTLRESCAAACSMPDVGNITSMLKLALI